MIVGGHIVGMAHRGHAVDEPYQLSYLVGLKIYLGLGGCCYHLVGIRSRSRRVQCAAGIAFKQIIERVALEAEQIVVLVLCVNKPSVDKQFVVRT